MSRSASDDTDPTLMVIVSGPDAGKVDWHSSVIEEARKTGLAIDHDGHLTTTVAAQ